MGAGSISEVLGPCVGFGPKLGTRNSGQDGKQTAYNFLGINRIVHREDSKEKGIKKYRRERKRGKCHKAKNEEERR